MNFAVNVLLFQAGWFACVLGAAHGMAWIGAIAAVVVVAWHLTRVRNAKRELTLVAAAAVTGALFETVLVRTGWVRFPTGTLIEGTAPYWMVALWAMFGTTLNVSMRSLHARPWLAAALGAVGGPLAYYGGVRLGAMEFAAAGNALAAIAVGWAVLAPGLLGAARRLDGYARP